MKGNSIYWFIAIPTVICIIGIIVFYKLSFPAGLVYDRADWGAFGDYFGGLLNPILGVINIGLLAFLTKQVAKLDDDRFKEQKKIDKKRYKRTSKIETDRYDKTVNMEALRHEQNLKLQKEVALYELKHLALTGAVKILNDMYHVASDYNSVRLYELADRRNELFSHFKVHSYLIRRFSEAENIFRDPIQTLINATLSHQTAKQHNSSDLAEIADDLGKAIYEILTLTEKLVEESQQEFNLN